ncbi:MAG: hypothetical protein ACREJG_11455 [Candidatus Rokuibacteriota bacterium]
MLVCARRDGRRALPARHPTIGQELLVDWLADVFGIDQRALAARSLNPLL